MPVGGSSPDSGGRSRRTGMVALAVLSGINLLNYLDRYVVSALLPDIKRGPMHLSDFKLGTLMSGFLVVYTLVAPVLRADRRSRLAHAPDRHRRLPLESCDRTLRARRAIIPVARRARRRRNRRGGLCDHRLVAACGFFPAAHPRAGIRHIQHGHPGGRGARLHRGRRRARSTSAGMRRSMLPASRAFCSRMDVFGCPILPGERRREGTAGPTPSRSRTDCSPVPGPCICAVAATALRTHRPRLRCLHFRARRPRVLGADLPRARARHSGRESLGGIR